MNDLIDDIENLDGVVSCSQVGIIGELEVELKNSLTLQLFKDLDFSIWKIQPIYDNEEIEEVPGVEYSHPRKVSEGELIGEIQRYANVSRLRLGTMSIPDEKRALHRLCTSISFRLSQLMNENDMSVEDLANETSKSEEYIRRALGGGIDFKLSTIAEFTAVFEDDVIESCYEVDDETKRRRRKDV